MREETGTLRTGSAMLCFFRSSGLADTALRKVGNMERGNVGAILRRAAGDCFERRHPSLFRSLLAHPDRMNPRRSEMCTGE